MSGLPAAPRVRPSAARSFLQFTLTLLAYAVVGPPVGAFVVIVSFSDLLGDLGGIDRVLSAMLMLIYGWWVAYPVGILPALTAGVAVAVKKVFFGGASLPFAAAIGALVGIGWGFVLPGGWNNGDLDLGVPIAIGSVIATLLCWLIVLGWRPPAAPSR